MRHPDDTNAVTVSGDSMTVAGIEVSEIQIVYQADKSANKSIVIASIVGSKQ
jgi:SOS-response transcriptional repressor LexA